MSSPTQTCKLCSRTVVVTPDGRGFPPDIAKSKLAQMCRANGCPSDPIYRAGIWLNWGYREEESPPSPVKELKLRLLSLETP